MWWPKSDRRAVYYIKPGVAELLANMTTARLAPPLRLPAAYIAMAWAFTAGSGRRQARPGTQRRRQSLQR